MSEAKHVQGPWSVETYGFYALIEPSVAWVGYGTSHDKATHVANARLIAAAPDLLEACENALYVGNDPDTVSKIRSELRAAIAKAKGES